MWKILMFEISANNGLCDVILAAGADTFWSEPEQCQKIFHDLNSQNKFSLHRENKVFNCVHELFYFCEWRSNSCNTY